jgi:hypothetical protein
VVDLAGVEVVDDGAGGVVGEGEDAFAGVWAAVAQVVHASGRRMLILPVASRRS